jgi:hypothetical protein
MGLEVSRLTRSNFQMARLVELCGVFDTLIADHDGIYQPREPNDLMILGFKGTVSELELGTIKLRMLEGANHKAKRGELWTNVPVGYLKEGRDKIIKDPNQRVQDMISKVFSKFLELGSAKGVFGWFIEFEIQFPKKTCRDGREIISWGAPTYSGICCILHNPVYGGAYGRGRRKIRKNFVDDMWHSRIESISEPEDWDEFILDNHDSYITWSTHLEIKRTMMGNCKRKKDTKGPVQKGAALLQGLVRCKRCGRRMTARYGGKSGRVTSYYCQGQATGTCRLFIGGERVETAVVNEVLRVVEPFGLRASMEALAAFNAEHEEKVRLLDLEISQAEYQATLARSRYEEIDPRNRLVAANLEKSWNQALEKVEELDQRRDVLLGSHRELNEDDRGLLLDLARDLPRLWKEETTTPVMKKQIIRSVTEEIWLDHDDASVQVDIHWKGGQVSGLLVERRRVLHAGADENKTLALIRQLAGQMPDDQIISWLNRLRIKTGGGNEWTEKRLRSYRSKHKIAVFKPDQREFETMGGAATELGLTVDQVRSLIKRGILPGTQVIPGAPWAIKRHDLSSETVQKAVNTIKNNDPEALKPPWRESQKNLF